MLTSRDVTITSSPILMIKSAVVSNFLTSDTTDMYFSEIEFQPVKMRGQTSSGEILFISYGGFRF